MRVGGGMAVAAAVLQWGRAQVSAEMCFWRSIGRTASLLQWGRAQVSAEIKFVALAERFRALLQWGRAQVSAEMAYPHGSATEDRGASMGPRSGERGNVPEVPVAAVRLMLQWGRAQVSAEISIQPGLPTTACGLQWGRAQVSAEITTAEDVGGAVVG